MTEPAAVPQPPAPPESTGTTSRAGRNLPAAIAAGVGLGGIALATLYFASWTFTVLAVVVVWVGAVELARALGTAGIRVAREPILVSLPIMGFVAYEFGAVGHLALFAGLVLVVMLFRLAFGIEHYVRDVTGSLFVAAYLPLMLGFAIVTLSADDGAARIITFIALTIGSDIGGYIAGVLFGKHPMAPAISPKKSWEGFAGSVLMQSVLGALCFVFLLDAPVWQGVVAGLVMTVSATAGDFIESAVKRDLGVKDMGNSIPGHGGVMDRLDSLIPNAFVSWGLFTLFLGS